MKHFALYDYFFKNFLSNYDDKKGSIFSESIRKHEEELINLIGEDGKNILSRFKHSIINHMQELEMDNMYSSFSYGVLVGMEVQEIINDYINEDT